MAGPKLVVLYPYPQDVVAFERAYTEEHAPMVNESNMKGITKFVATKVVAHAFSISSGGKPLVLIGEEDMTTF